MFVKTFKRIFCCIHFFPANFKIENCFLLLDLRSGFQQCSYSDDLCYFSVWKKDNYFEAYYFLSFFAVSSIVHISYTVHCDAIKR